MELDVRTLRNKCYALGAGQKAKWRLKYDGRPLSDWTAEECTAVIADPDCKAGNGSSMTRTSAPKTQTTHVALTLSNWKGTQ